MTTGRLDFGDLMETVGPEKLNEVVVGASYLAAVIATLPDSHKKMVTYMLVDALDGPESRLPILSTFMLELVALHEVHHCAQRGQGFEARCAAQIQIASDPARALAVRRQARGGGGIRRADQRLGCCWTPDRLLRSAHASLG